MSFNQGHALVIGIGTYAKTPRMNVPITARDATRLAGVLRDPRYCGYPEHQVTLLTDQRATRDTILAALDTLAAHAKSDDTVLLFYSGHGDYGSDGYYLTTYETESASGGVVAGTGIRDAELLEKLNRLAASRVLLIFNACHSGALAPDSLGEQAEGTDSGVPLPDALGAALLGTGTGRVVITACQAQQKSYFVPADDTTLFAQAMLDGLQGRGVSSRHNYISAFDLYEYVHSYTSGEVRRRWGRAQDPVLTVHQGIGAMAVALYRGQPGAGAPSLAERPAKLGGAAREIDPAESRRQFEQILNGTINLAAGRDITGNTIVGGDQLDARESQGLVNRPAGPVSQNFGEQRNVNTGGGDYAEGDIDKRSGVFVSGGTIHGPVVGTNAGSISVAHGSAPQGQPGGRVTLREVQRRLRQMQDAAHDHGDKALSAELDGVDRDLSAALRAEGGGDDAQRARRVQRVKDDLAYLAHTYPHLQELVRMLEGP